MKPYDFSMLLDTTKPIKDQIDEDIIGIRDYAERFNIFISDTSKSLKEIAKNKNYELNMMTDYYGNKQVVIVKIRVKSKEELVMLKLKYDDQQIKIGT